MRFFPSLVFHFFRQQSIKNSLRAFSKFVVFLALVVALYSLLFHVVMAYEDRNYTLIDGLYWTVVTMTTLGYGDITFHTDLGRLFSLVVLVSGVIFLLAMLPFVFTRFFYIPLMEAQKEASIPREVPEGTSGHVLLSNPDALVSALIQKLKQYGYSYYILVPEHQKALDLQEQSYSIIYGDIGNSETYRRSAADRADMVLFNHNDKINTNAVFTLREVSGETRVVSCADSLDSVDILELAGSDRVFHFTGMLGQALARRVLGVRMESNIIGRFSDLLIAESPVMRTPLEDRSIRESGLRENTGVNIIGIWERGSYRPPHPDTVLTSNTVLVLAGSREQLQKYNELYGSYELPSGPVLILGGGRVGDAAAQALEESGIEYRIVEKNPRIAGRSGKHVSGSASDLHILQEAGIDNTPSIIITTHDDDLNIYLTIYCRRLRSDVQIITRANRERNISKLHEAGADLAMSYASMGANTIVNYLRGENVLMFAEGLDIFREEVPASLEGKTLQNSDIRARTGCNVIAIDSRERGTDLNPGPETVLRKGQELILIGTSDSEKQFMQAFRNKRKSRNNRG